MAFVSFYVGAALIGLLFPLYIMLAADSNPKMVYQRGGLGWLGLGQSCSVLLWVAKTGSAS